MNQKKNDNCGTINLKLSSSLAWTHLIMRLMEVAQWAQECPDQTSKICNTRHEFEILKWAWLLFTLLDQCLTDLDIGPSRNLMCLRHFTDQSGCLQLNKIHNTPTVTYLSKAYPKAVYTSVCVFWLKRQWIGLDATGAGVDWSDVCSVDRSGLAIKGSIRKWLQKVWASAPLVTLTEIRPWLLWMSTGDRCQILDTVYRWWLQCDEAAIILPVTSKGW